MTGLVGIGRLKKETNRIDINGNIINPKTNEVVGNVDDKYVPSKEDVEIMKSKKGGEEKLSKEELKKTPAPMNIEDMIQKKIEAIIEKKISDVLEKMLG